MSAPLVAFPRDDLPFPGSLPEFQQLFPDDLACAAYLVKLDSTGGPVLNKGGTRSLPDAAIASQPAIGWSPRLTG